MNKISIVAPNYNDSKYFDRWFQALFLQTERPYEVILVDDASTDGSLVYLEKIANTHPSWIKLVSLKQNTGGFGAFIEGLKVATGDFVACWSMDDEMCHDYIEKMAHFIHVCKTEDLFLCRAIIEREGHLYCSKQHIGGAVIFSPDSFARGLRENSIGCFIGHILRRTTMLDYIEKGGGEIKACFDAMYIYFTGLSKGAVLVNDFLVIYHARFGGLGTRHGWRKNLDHGRKILSLCKQYYPTIYSRLIDSHAFYWTNSLKQSFALWLVPRLPEFLRHKFFEVFYESR